MPTIGRRLKELRATTGKSQQALSEMSGSTQSSINRFENDQSEAPYKVLLWYADYFDVSMDYIYCRTDKPQGKPYDFKPNIPIKDLPQFIEMCFDKDSPMSERLKQSIITLFEEGGKNG